MNGWIFIEVSWAAFFLLKKEFQEIRQQWKRKKNKQTKLSAYMRTIKYRWEIAPTFSIIKNSKMYQINARVEFFLWFFILFGDIRWYLFLILCGFYLLLFCVSNHTYTVSNFMTKATILWYLSLIFFFFSPFLCCFFIIYINHANVIDMVWIQY